MNIENKHGQNSIQPEEMGRNTKKPKSPSVNVYQGRNAHIEELFVGKNSQLVGLARSLNASTDPEDVVQDAWEGLLTHGATEEGKYLSMSVRNRAVSAARRERPGRYNSGIFDELFPESSDTHVYTMSGDPIIPHSTEDQALLNRDAERIYYHISQLTPRLREAILLELEGKSQAEKARIMNISKNGVTRNLQRARAALRTMILEDREFEF